MRSLLGKVSTSAPRKEMGTRTREQHVLQVANNRRRADAPHHTATAATHRVAFTADGSSSTRQAAHTSLRVRASLTQAATIACGSRCTARNAGLLDGLLKHTQPHTCIPRDQRGSIASIGKAAAATHTHLQHNQRAVDSVAIHLEAKLEGRVGVRGHGDGDVETGGVGFLRDVCAYVVTFHTQAAGGNQWQLQAQYIST